MIILQIHPATVPAKAAHVLRFFDTAAKAQSTGITLLFLRYHAGSALLAEMLVEQRIFDTHAAGVALGAFTTFFAKTAEIAGLHVHRDKAKPAGFTELATFNAVISVALALVRHLEAVFTEYAVVALLHGAVHAHAAAVAELLTVLAVAALMAIDESPCLTAVAPGTGNVLVHGFSSQLFMALRTDLAALGANIDTVGAASAKQAVIHIFLTSAAIRAGFVFAFSTQCVVAL